MLTKEYFDQRLNGINKRFDSVDKKFDLVDQRFDSVDKKIEDEIYGLAAMTAKGFDAVDKSFDSLGDILQELKEGQKRLLEVTLEIPSKKAFGRLENKIQTFDVRLTSVERKVK